jgi:hypothetical protein
MDFVVTSARATKSWLVKMLGAAAGTFGMGAAGAAVAVPPVIKAQEAAATQDRFESLWDVPASWQAFAARVQARFHERLSEGDDAAQKVRTAFQEDARAGGGTFVLARVWVEPAGIVTRVDFHTPNNDLQTALREALLHNDIGVTPPTGMLQPLRLKLFLDRSQ